VRRKLRYANVIATLALFVSLGGGAYAATQLPKHSVGTKQLKSGAVTPAKLSRAAKQRLTGRPGQKGEPGAKGSPGPKGDTGPSDVYLSHIPSGTIAARHEESISLAKLPAGSYLVESKITAYTLEGTMKFVCDLREQGGEPIDRSQVSTTEFQYATIVNQAAVTLSDPGTISLVCLGEGTGDEWDVEGPGSLIATKVGAIHPGFPSPPPVPAAGEDK
jgi:hypothetical protein